MSNCSFEEAYFTFNAWYEGLGEAEYDGIIEWLDSLETDENGRCYASILDVRDRFTESLDLLGILVIMFGSYGTSPRGGWIEYTKEASEWLKSKQKEWTEDE